MGKELLIETLLCFFLEVHQRLGVKKTNLYLATGNPRETLLCCYSDSYLKLAFGLYCVYAVKLWHVCLVKTYFKK